MTVPADALIKNFCEMLLPQLKTGGAENLERFQDDLILILQKRNIKDDPLEANYIKFLKQIYNALMPADEDIIYSATGKRGTYGEVLTVAGKPTIIKHVAFYQGNDIISFRYFLSLLKELLIQFILSSDPEFGFHVPKLHSVKRHGAHTLLVEMEKADYTFRDWLIDNIARNSGVLRFDNVRPKIKEILKVLEGFHKKYAFAHRDFKLDNIMYSGIGQAAILKFIDFGMSCIGFTYGGAPVKIMNDMYYVSTSTCKIEQDIGLFLLRFLTEMQKYLDADFMNFLTSARAVNFKRHLEGLKSGLELDHRAYNKNGTLFGTAPVSEFFKPAEVMRLLDVLRLPAPSTMLKSTSHVETRKRTSPRVKLGTPRRSSRLLSRKNPLATITRKGAK